MVRHVLVWDAPNIDMSLGDILDDKPTARERPDMHVLGRWLVDRVGGPEGVEGCVFVNVAPHAAGALRGWVLWLLEEGFRVFAKPKEDDGDIDQDMLDHLWARLEGGGLESVHVGSNDVRNFLGPLEELTDRDVDVTVLGFSEYAAGLRDHELIEFVDLEDIPGLFTEPLPRVDLGALPAEGRWFEPSGRLGADDGG